MMLRQLDGAAPAATVASADSTGNHGRRTGRLAVLLTAAVCMIALEAACGRAAGPTDATSNRAARDEALRAIPWQQLQPQDRQSLHQVVSNASIYRRLPTRVIDCDPEMFTFLVQHPEVVVDVWRVMGISNVKLDKQPNGLYHGADGAGTAGSVKFLHGQWGQGAQNLAIIYADGAYEGKPFVTPIRAQSVMILRSGSIQETNGRYYVTVRVDSFVHIGQMGVELVAKTVQPWISKAADQNFIETLSFVSNFSRTAERNPQGMQRLAARLPTIDEPTRSQLVQLCFQTADRYAQAEQANPAGAVLIAHRDAALTERAQ